MLDRLAETQHGVFSRRQLSELGYTAAMVRARVRSGRWIALSRDVFRLPGVPESWRQWLLAAVLAAGPDAVASHRSAAALWRMPGMDEGPLEVLRPRGGRRRQPIGRLHETVWLPPHHRRQINGIPVTSPVRTLFDLADTEHPFRVERLVDDALTRRLVKPGALRAMFAELDGQGRVGLPLMRRLLEKRGDGYVAPESELEARFLRSLDRAGLPPPVRQPVVGGERPIGRVDFAYPDAKLLIELDSRRHHTALLDRRNDNRRDNEAACAGFRVLRIYWEDVQDAPALVRDSLRAAR